MNPMLMALLQRSLPTEEDVVSARARRSEGGTPDRQDVLLDRFGTGQEMGPIGVPVSMAYEASKPLLRSSPMLNSLLGKIAGPEQMVDETTDNPSFGEAMSNIGATTAGAGSSMLQRLLQAFQG